MAKRVVGPIVTKEDVLKARASLPYDYAGHGNIKMIPDRLEKILEAVRRGYNRTETAAYAGITTTTLRNYEAEHPEFVEAQEAAKTVLIAKARENVYNKIVGGDIAVSQWLLERKCKEEYSTRTESKIDGEVKHTLDNQGLSSIMARINSEVIGARTTNALQAPSED